MTERRIVQSVHTREVIPTSLAGDNACYLLAMTGDQIEILMNLMNYAHRRINFCDEVIDSARYFLPDDAKWDELSVLVADLEYRLMDTCSLDQIIALLECICNASRQNVTAPPGGWTREDDGTFPLISPVPDTTPQVDEDACALAQLTWQMTWEILTEQMIPAADYFYSTLVPGVVALCVVWGIEIWPLLGVAAIGVAVTALLNGAWDAATSNLLNWMLANKQEAICLLYAGWQAGQVEAQHAWETNIEAAAPGEISILDGLAVKICLAMALPAALKAWALQTPWSVGLVQEGVCDDCMDFGCYDFCAEDPAWWVAEFAHVTDCTLHIGAPGVGLPEAAVRTWTIAGSSFDVEIHGKGALDESHYAMVVDFMFQDASHNPTGLSTFWELLTTDDDFAWYDSAISAPGTTHCHVRIRGVTMTDGWVYYICVKEAA